MSVVMLHSLGVEYGTYFLDTKGIPLEEQDAHNRHPARIYPKKYSRLRFKVNLHPYRTSTAILGRKYPKFFPDAGLIWFELDGTTGQSDGLLPCAIAQSRSNLKSRM